MGSTELTNRLGDEPAREILGASDQLARDQIERHRGREVKGTGDGLMVAFTSARRAVTCSVDIQRAMAEQRNREPARAVSVRIGLNTGEVVREEEDLFGATVNAAARIAAEGDAGDILVSEGVKIVLGSATTAVLEEHGEAQLKGFGKPWRLYSVQWEEAAARDSALSSARTPYVGRQVERAQLRQLLERASNGHGGLVMIGGEPGVGKTRIAEELIAEAEGTGFLALVGHCYEMEGAPPYLPFVEIMQAAARSATPEALRTALGDEAPEVAKIMPELRRLLPDIPPPLELPPEQERHYLFDSLRSFTARASAAQPIVMLLDDLHWADDSTLLLVQHYAQQLSEMSVLMVGTYRDVELDVGRPLAKALEDLLRKRLAHRISIRRLPLEDVAGMLRAASGQDPPQPLVDAVYSETEGNPFFVEEVFQHFREEGKLFDEAGNWRAGLEVSDLDVPEGVRLVIGRRLQHVGEETRVVLTNAAVIGRVFSFDLLDAVGDEGADRLLDAVDEAEAAHLITPVDAEGREARYTFSHELIRQTLISSLSLPRRQRLHLHIAEAMEQTYDQTIDEHVADLAHHLYQSGAAADVEKTVRYLALAGSEALAAAAFEDALRYYENALSLEATDDARTRADLLYKRGLALRSVGRWDEALVTWQEALDGYEDLGAAEAAALVSYDLAIQFGWVGRPEEGIAAARRGLDAVGEEESALHCRLLSVAGVTSSGAGDYATASRFLAKAISMAESQDDPQLLAEALRYEGFYHWHYLRFSESVESGLRAIDLARSTGDLWVLADALFMTQLSLVFLGSFDDADKIAEELEPLADRLGHKGATMCAGRSHELVEISRTADFNRLEEFADLDEDLCTRAGMPWVSHSHTWRGLAHFWRGRDEEALEEFKEAVRLDPPDVWASGDRGVLMMARAYADDSDGARALWQQPREEPAEAGTIGIWTRLFFEVEALAVLGDREEAARLYPMIQRAIEGGAMLRVFDAQPIHSIAGMAAAAGQQWELAEQHYQAALRQAHELPVLIAQPEVRRWYARMLIDRDGPGDEDKARALIKEAVAGYRKLGMPKHVELAEALLSSA